MYDGSVNAVADEQTRTALQQAIGEAQTVADKPSLDKAAVDAAKEKLTNAVNAVVESQACRVPTGVAGIWGHTVIGCAASDAAGRGTQTSAGIGACGAGLRLLRLLLLELLLAQRLLRRRA